MSSPSLCLALALGLVATSGCSLSNESPSQTLWRHSQPVSSVAYSADGKQIASGSTDEVVVWEAGTGNVVNTFMAIVDESVVPQNMMDFWKATLGLLFFWDDPKEAESAVGALQFSSDGSQLTYGTHRFQALVFDVKGMRQLPKHVRPSDTVSIRKSPNGRFFAISSTYRYGSSRPTDERTIEFVRADSGEVITQPTPGSIEMVYGLSPGALAFTPDGRALVLASDRRLDRLQLDGQGHITGAKSAPNNGITGHYSRMTLSMSPDGKRVALTGPNEIEDFKHVARIFDVETLAETRTLLRGERYIDSVSFSPDGARAVLTVGDELRVIEAATGITQRTIKGPTRAHDACFSPDGRQIASAWHDGAVRIYASTK